MNDVVPLLNLPTATLIALAGGYAGYRIWATGKDAGHGAMDVVFGSLVFALISRLATTGMESAGSPVILQAATGVLASVAAAMVWRKWGESLFFRALRGMRVSISDRHRTAWDPARVNPDLHPTQIIVRRKDGVQLMCERVSRFNSTPTGCCCFGADGSVALYVTDVMEPGADDWESQSPDGPDDWGTLMTYVPASEVAQLMVRY